MAKKTVVTETLPTDPATINPQTTADYVLRAWLYYTAKEYPRAEADFRQALQAEDDLDTHFALGLTLKAMSRFSEAQEEFQYVLDHLDKVTDTVRARMLARMARGHINTITKGDWDLEKEVWNRV